MPVIKTQDELSANTVNLQPKQMSSKIQLILAYDLCGWKTGRIAQELGMTEGRISIIKSSPLYRRQRELRWQELQNQVTNQKATEVAAGDPVLQKFKEAAPRMADMKIELADSAESEFVRNAAINDCLAQAGYDPKSKVEARPRIEVSEKIAERFLSIVEDKPISIIRERTITMDVDNG